MYHIKQTQTTHIKSLVWVNASYKWSFKTTAMLKLTATSNKETKAQKP